VFVLGVLLCIFLLAHVSMFAAAKDTEPEKREAGKTTRAQSREMVAKMLPRERTR
jgi:ABC-type nitrate/sulfonate/bicarbonate transport system permease component